MIIAIESSGLDSDAARPVVLGLEERPKPCDSPVLRAAVAPAATDLSSGIGKERSLARRPLIASTSCPRGALDTLEVVFASSDLVERVSKKTPFSRRGSLSDTTATTPSSLPPPCELVSFSVAGADDIETMING